MTDRDDAARMLAVAEIDLKAIRNMLDSGLFEEAIFGFHAQQAVEKALKAWLSLRSVAYPKTHDLRFLIHLLHNQAHEESDRFVELTDLTDFAVQFRYDYPEPTEALNRAEVLMKVEELWNYVAQLVRKTPISK